VKREPTGATYVYALLRRRAGPPLASAPAGVPQAGPLRALQAGEALWLVVATVPASAYGSESIDGRLRDLEWVAARAVAHDAVVAHLLGRGDLLPMRLFTLFASDERALAHFAKRRASLGRLLDKVQGREEWGVRLSFERAVAGGVRDAPSGWPGTQAVGEGRRFLRRKAAQLEARGRAASDASRTAGQLFRELRRHAADAALRPPADPRAPLLLDAAFLVSRDGRSRFKSAARRARARLEREGFALSLSGPWPAYNFAGKA
jgi:hypothetical protein